MNPADPDARQQMVIVHSMSTAINVDLLSTPAAFLWLKRRVVAGEPRSQLLGLVEGAVPRSVHLLGLGRFHVGLYTPQPDLCGHCCRFRYQSWKCKSAPRCRYCSGSHPSSRCLEKIHASTRVIPLCCNCMGDHNASLRRCPAWPRPVRETQTSGTTLGLSRVVFRPAPAPQHNAWANGVPSWSDFPALPLPAAQPSAFPPLLGTAAPSQSGAAHPPVPATRPPVPVPRRTAPYYVAVVGAEDVAPASQADVPATLQDVCPPLSSQRPNLPTRTSPRVCQPAPDLNQCLQLSSLPQITSPRVCRPAPGPNQYLLLSSLPQISSLRVRQPARGPSQCLSWYILRPSPPLIASPRVCRLLGPSESSHRPQYSHRYRRPRPSPCLCWIARLCGLGPPSVETDLVLDEMDTDEEWAPTAAQTLDWLQAELATVTEKLAWVHQQVSLSQVGGA
ncbi:hypothetical protein E2C01_056717 [Portunus trituberculatus]|uniref:Nucleic-acid-binding protein from transposon X-element n=1 Tax=Portunus trituberculatus TaxID=210409 RepID=A0A5B7H0D3_PORTR|nr:hypothetical protein [Portunus trituberculatus]